MIWGFIKNNFWNFYYSWDLQSESWALKLKALSSDDGFLIADGDWIEFMVIRNNSPLPLDLFLLFQRGRRMIGWESFTDFTGFTLIENFRFRIIFRISRSFNLEYSIAVVVVAVPRVIWYTFDILQSH